MSVVQQPDLYDLLGARRDDTPEALRHAFRERARALHPDVSEEPDAVARFAELSQAYEVLSRPSARLLYDRFGYIDAGTPGGEAAQAAATPRGGEAAQAAATARGEEATRTVDIELTAIEAARGTRRRVGGGGDMATLVAIPAGIDDGQVLEVDGTDLRLRVRIREHDARLVRWAAAVGAVAAAALFVALAVAPEVLAF